MSQSIDPKLGINSWLQDELYQQYLHDGKSVDEGWKKIFEANGSAKPAAAPANGSVVLRGPDPKSVQRQAPVIPIDSGAQLVPLRGAALRTAENMTASLSIPVATSERIVGVKVIDENRRILNQHRELIGKSKISYTHLIGWAIVRAMKSSPNLNHAFTLIGSDAFRVVYSQVNLGIAIDVAGRDGTRSLKVPNIKGADGMSFGQYLAAFDDIVARARANKLTIADFEGTTISLTNPGTVGTFGSIARLMPGQGAIIATGAIDYPAEYQGVSNEMRSTMGLSKVMMVTCTYDHRVIQGAESGNFLGTLQALIEGDENFYESIFSDLAVPHQPVRWRPDRQNDTSVAAPAIDAGKQAAVFQLVHSYRVRGHLIADLDPLGYEPTYHSELDPASYGLTLWDLDRQFLTGALKQSENGRASIATLREILDMVRRTYCGKIACEYMHIQHPEQKQWLQHRMEPTANSWQIDSAIRLRILNRVIEAEEFEHFLQNRFVGQKRFGLEGAETAIAILDEVIDRAANHNVNEIVIGMAHRGRLNVLANVVGKSMVQVFSEFEGDPDPESTQGSGDVKYHLGATGTRRSTEGKEILVSVAFNPSHLEAVDPVVEGIVRPKQDRLADTERERVIPFLIHGDAAFAGQGVVAETLNLSQLEGYCTGGTIHLIINNQIGFTTSPTEGRSTQYSTDVARMVQAPIFHVNGDDPDAAIRVAQMAYDYRQQFKKDVVIDMICYRRHGHNEADEPSFTQPILYSKIRRQPSVAVQYSERLTAEKLVDQPRVEQMRKAVSTHLNDIYDQAQQNKEQYEIQELTAVSEEAIHETVPNTAVQRSTLEQVIQRVTSFEQDFHLHPKLKGFIDRRKEALQGGPIDWGFAETLAFGSLVLEGTPVRLSGQDSGRGTFTQRHLKFYDSENGRIYVPLQELSPGQAAFDVFDSSLSEYAVMGFEFGYSVADPLTLVMWEAQFGDFANGAQIMIDQFVTNAEQKWSQPSGLVLLLPHGYEGQGPEHSSARIERFLQLCAENNIQIANCTTPAQYFHVLRRQMHGGPDRRGIRKPLIVFTPKFLLRFPKAASKLEELSSGAFQEVIGDATANPSKVSRLLLCSGKIYYDLVARREERHSESVAIVRVEQLYPFPATQLREILRLYSSDTEVVWVQEEPRNMGPWSFVQERMQPILENSGRGIRYAGRHESASPAAGPKKVHDREQAEIVEEAFAAGAMVRNKKRFVRKRRK